MKHEYITTNIATEILGLKSKSWVRNILNKMVEDKTLIAEGANRNRVYKIRSSNRK